MSFIALVLSAQLLVAQSFLKADFIAKNEAKQANRYKSDFALTPNCDMLKVEANFTLGEDFNEIEGYVTHYIKVIFSGPVQFELSNNLAVNTLFVDGVSVEYIHVNDVIEIPSKYFQANTKYRISIGYKGAPNPSENGFDSYVVDKHDGAPVMWTLSEPYGAKEWWPVRQDLNDKIDTSDIYITVPPGNYGVSNGLLMDSTEVFGRIAYHWKHNYAIDYYLIAIAVTNYQRQQYTLDLSTGTLPIENFLYPENYADYSVQSRENDLFMLFYDSLIGAYPFHQEKYGHTQFGFGGGMEHQTNSFMNNFHFELTSHELAHQWFGDMITCASWQDIWIQESFATYFTGLCYERFSPELYWPIWRNQTMKRILNNDTGSVFVRDTTSVARIFDSNLSYYKGAMMLHQLRGQLGDVVFFKAIRNYLGDEKLRFKTAKSADAIGHFESAASTDLSAYFSRWLYGKGYPTYILKWYTQNEETVFSVEQRWDDDERVNFPLQVPVTFYSNGNDTTFNIGLDAVQFVNLGFMLDSVKLDPNNWLIAKLKRVENIAKDGSKLTVYPNPTTELFHAEIIGALGTKVQYILFDENGKKVRELESITSKSVSFSASNLRSGVYTLWANTQLKEYSQKVVIAH